MHLGLTPKFLTEECGLTKLETSLYSMTWSVFQYLKLFRHGSRVWQMERRMNRHCDSKCCAYLHYLANNNKQNNKNIVCPLPANLICCPKLALWIFVN